VAVRAAISVDVIGNAAGSHFPVIYGYLAGSKLTTSLLPRVVMRVGTKR
jgi:hypothetical protein